MKIGWVAMIALVLLLAVKVGLMQMRADTARAPGDGLLFEAKDSAVRAAPPPTWKPILL